MWGRLPWGNRGGIGKERALVMELLHQYSGLKVSAGYRLPDGLNGLNEQRSLPSGLAIWMKVW